MAKQPLVEGSTLDGFLIGEKLHSGGMATLWKVTRPDIPTPIVMKVPMILDGDDATTIVGFEMEQMILPMLSGPHVPKLFGIGDFATQPYIVMEYVEGESLLPRLDAAPRPVEEVIDIGVKVARALTDLHRQHVLHLDIKPSNIMLRPNGEAVFIDFGLSRHEMLPDLLAEEFHLPMGTGPYISPEQILKNRTDPRSDIFSLGVLLYHLLTKQRPFGFPRNNSGLRKRLWRDPVPPRAISPEIPPWLQEIVLRCLESDPDKRYPTAAQLAFDRLGRVDRLDVRTNQTKSVDPTMAQMELDRTTWTLPLVFSRRDPRVLYFANQRVFRTVEAEEFHVFSGHVGFVIGKHFQGGQYEEGEIGLINHLQPAER